MSARSKEEAYKNLNGADILANEILIESSGNTRVVSKKSGLKLDVEEVYRNEKKKTSPFFNQRDFHIPSPKLIVPALMSQAVIHHTSSSPAKRRQPRAAKYAG